MAPDLTPPAFLWQPPHTSTAGGEAVALAASLGITLDAEQRLALDVILAEGPDGHWAAFEVGLIAARQNLKTFVLEVLVLADLFVFGAQLVIWTSHLFSTTREAFRDIRGLIDNHDHLRRRVRRISTANGKESIELVTGQRLLFVARTKSSGRGLTGDRIILDESFALGPAEMGSLLPTLSARSNSQIVYASSAGMVTSDVLRSIRDRGRAGDDPRLAYLEWCALRQPCGTEHCSHHVGSVECQLDNVSNWRAANPAMGRRILQSHIEAERRSLPPAEFARERLGWWEDPEESVGAALPLDAWNDCLDRTSQVAAIQRFAFDIATDSSWAAVAVAGIRHDGRDHIEVVEYRPGTDWLASRLAELLVDHGKVPVVMDGKGPGAALVPELLDAGIEPVLMNTAEIAQACGALVDRLLRRTVRHIGQGELDTAARSAVRRLLSDSWIWSRRNSPVEISPLVAATLALSSTAVPPVDEPTPGFVSMADLLQEVQ